MTLTSVDFKITFNVVNHTFKITDTTDYAGQGVGSLTGYSAAITASDPMGNAYATTIANLASSLISGNITPVLDSSGDFVLGNYAITYVVTTNTATTFTTTKTFAFDYVSPEVSVSMTFDETLPLLSSQDDTSYIVSGITPSITRTHSILFPPALAIADYTVSTALLETSSNLYTNSNGGYQYTGEVSSVLVYTMASDFIINDTVTGFELITIVSNTTLCAVYCAIKTLYDRYVNALCNSKVKADDALDKLYKVTMLASLIKQAMLCGKSEDVTAYYNRILLITESNGDCDCGSGEPVLITGLGGGSGGTDTTSVVVNSDGALVITPVTVGTVTTYTVNLSAANLALLGSIHNTVIEGGNGISIDSYTDASGTVHYQVENTLVTTPNNYMAFDIEIENASTDEIPTINVVNVTYSGTEFTGAPSVTFRTLINNGLFAAQTSTLSPTDQQFIDGICKLEITDIFNTTPSKYPKIFAGVKRAFFNRTGMSSTFANILEDTPTINIVSESFTVHSYYKEGYNEDYISIGLRWINPAQNTVSEDVTGNVFYRYSTQGSSAVAKPQVFMTISVFILL